MDTVMIDQINPVNQNLKIINNLLNVANTVAGILLTSKKDTSNDDLVFECMRIIGTSLDVDRLEVWQNEKRDEKLYAVMIHQWQTPLGELGRSHSPVLEIAYDDTPGWEKRLQQAECINGVTTELSQEDQDFLTDYSIKSVFVMPLFIENNFWGMFIIDNCHESKVFTDNEILILKLIRLHIESNY